MRPVVDRPSLFPQKSTIVNRQSFLSALLMMCNNLGRSRMEAIARRLVGLPP
jgi:hypothetical protein